MDIREIMNNLNNNKKDGPGAYYVFETIILNLLKEYVKKQNKILIMNKIIKMETMNFEFDAVAPDGLDDLPAETVIELKLSSKSIRMSHFYDRFINRINYLPEIKGLLFIFGTELTSKERDMITQKTISLSNIKVRVWDINDISRVMGDIQLPELYNNIDSLNQLVINNTIANSLKSDVSHWKEVRNERINKLKQIYSKDDLVLFLGAGISKKAGTPDWNSLISELMVKMIEGKLKDNNININKIEQNKIVQGMKDFKDYSPLLQASYIKSGLGINFESEVAKALYSDFNKINKGTSSLLKSLAKLCIPRRNGIGIRAIVTYNFDDLLEVNLDDQTIFYKAIYHENDTASVDELPIYHVHGFIPRDPENYTQLKESLLIFSEDGYHTLYNDAYSWQNIIQLNYLRENTCLMVGLSMTDPNLRRLLSIATRKFEEPKHFVIMKRQSFLELSTETGIRKDILENFTVVNQELQENFFKSIGVNVIWVEDYDEIPQLLNSIANISSKDNINKYVAITREE